MNPSAVSRQPSSVFRLPSSVLLYGPSGSGKSTLGRILAENLNLPFVDLDEEIEAQSGMQIPEIFASEGESGFRRRETRVLRGLLAPREQVVALGGGALTRPENQALAKAHGNVVVLNGALEELVARLAADTTNRPLLAGDARIRLENLLTKRGEHYRSFNRQVDTSGKDPHEIAWEIQVMLGMFHLKGMASAKHQGYDVRVQPGGLDVLGEMLESRRLRGPVAVVTDENVGASYLSRVTATLRKSGFSTHGITIPPGEEHKTLKTVSQLWAAFSSAKIERSSTVVALGGGVVGDLAGFAAATWLRGVPWVAVPTSLLAMVDASMGGKTGADLAHGKNLIGAFHPPRLVLADPDVLETLPEVEFANGMAEVVKHGVIGDAGLFDLCAAGLKVEERANIVRRAMAVKVKLIETDPYEKGIRAALNLGHTVGHGVELASGFAIRHGEAVAIGMVVEARMAEEIGLAAPGTAKRMAEVLAGLELPTEIPEGLDRSQIIAAMRCDKKKAAGIVKFALPAAIGDVRVGAEIDGWESMIGER